MKHLPYSLLVAAPLLLLSSPVHAAGIQSWRFDAAQNRLEFTTDGDVQPKAQLIADPTRLVIDLPGIVLGRPAFTESVGGTIRSVRIGQFDRGTTRVVIELAPGYTIDPDRVTFRGITARQWTVQLPTPMPMPIAATPPSTPPSTPDNSTVVPTTPTPPPVGTTIDPRPPVPSTLPPLFKPATIEAIELTGGGTQLLIRASQTLRYSTGWDRATGAYRLSISSAKLASNVKGPQFNSSSPIRSLRLRQEDANTVVILIQPAAGIRIAEPNLLGQTLALQLQSSRSAVAPTAPIATIPVPAAPRPTYPVPPRPTAPSPVNPRVPNGRVVVVVDPGHGGPDPGAVGIGGVREKDIVMDISRQVAALLEQQGVQAILTRTDDIDLDLEPRVQLAQRSNANLFVSIHANAISMSRPDINGLETYYYNSGEELARAIHSSILSSVDVADRRVRSARFYVLRKTSMPSVLVETGFVTGRDDAAKLSSPAYRSQMANAIVRGILQYIQRTARF